MVEIKNLETKVLVKGIHVKLIHTDSITLLFAELEEGAILPLHHHVHEQISQVLEGRFELTIGNDTKIYEPGQVAIIPSNTPHSGKALTACKIQDIFTPVREDYKLL